MAASTNLENYNVYKHKQDASCISSLVVGADIFPLEKSFSEENTREQHKAGDCPRLALTPDVV